MSKYLNLFLILSENIVNWRINLKIDMIMSKAIRILKVTFIFIFIVAFTCTGCATTMKNKIYSRKKESLCDLSHLGKNKYYYSKYYERKLTKSIKKIAEK